MSRLRAIARIVSAGLLIGLFLAGGPASAADRPFTVYIATWRGCEEVCEAFKTYLTSQGLAVEFVVRSADRRSEALPDMVKEAKALRPDLIATWGTGITLAFVGPWDAVDPAVHVTDTPVVFMYVTDPVGAKIVRSAQSSGRPNVAGSLYTIPAGTQLRAMESYRPLRRLAVIYSPNEVNSVGARDELRAAAAARGIPVVERALKLGADGLPLKDDIEAAVAEVAAAGPDFIAFGSNSFLMSNIRSFTAAANAAGVPVFSTGEKVLVEGNGLLGLIGSLRSIGQVSAYQAERILSGGARPEDLPTARLSRFTLMVNMPVARQLELYPPMTILHFAELLTE